MEQILIILGWTGGQVTAQAWGLAALRVCPMLMVMALLMARGASWFHRALLLLPLGGALSLFSVAWGGVAEPDDVTVWVSASSELLLGVGWACVAAAPFIGFHWAGGLVDRHSGALWAGTYGEGSGIWARFHLALAVVIFLAMGGHVWWIRGWYDGIGMVPIGSSAVVRSAEAIVLGMARLVSDCLRLALMMASSAIFAGLMVEVTVALLNRVNPMYSQRVQPPPITPVAVTAVIMLGLSLSVSELPALYREAFRAAEGLVRDVVP